MEIENNLRIIADCLKDCSSGEGKLTEVTIKVSSERYEEYKQWAYKNFSPKYHVDDSKPMYVLLNGINFKITK